MLQGWILAAGQEPLGFFLVARLTLAGLEEVTTALVTLTLVLTLSFQ